MNLLDLRDFRVGTYNMGSDHNDYNQLCQQTDFIPIDVSCQTDAHKIKLDNRYNQYPAVQAKSAAHIMRSKMDVLCLQEVNQPKDNITDRPLIKELTSNRFAVIGNEKGYSDAAVAINTDKFEKITPLLRTRDIVIVSAQETASKITFAFVSAHFQGVTLDQGPVDPLDADQGDVMSRTIAQALSQSDHTVQIIGADVNAPPERWKHRFDLLTDHGFTLVRSGKPTNVKPGSSYNPRELDYFFVKGPVNAIVDPTAYLPLDPTVNASDHAAIGVQMTAKKTRFQGFVQGVKKIISFIGQFFRKLVRSISS